MKIAVLFGAKSFEHEISVVSAIALKKVLKSQIVYIFCDMQRDFYLIDATSINAKRFSSGAYKKDPKLELKKGGFYQKSLMGSKKIECDFLLNMIHGCDGEDGKIAAMLEFFDIDFVGPRLEASVLSYNKLLTKLYAKEQGVRVLDYSLLHKNESFAHIDTFPIIIKPARLGSSIGISIVHNASEIEYALDVAFEFDDMVLIEPFVQGIKEYNLAGCKIDGAFVFSIIEEPQKEEFLDFDKKYLDFSRTKRVNEAQVDANTIEALEKNFQKIYANIFEGALIRCDFFVHENVVYLNEINPVPGSMANYLFSDFESVLLQLSKNLPQPQKILCEYRYINSIQRAKGK
ncbi:MAG: D-alanine--D-alanine ligase [Sulfurospirillum sp.]|nr:D-alanine--D-alanine ligase [Sulfurospirillum sp.]